jgi:hypothetical protein
MSTQTPAIDVPNRWHLSQAELQAGLDHVRGSPQTPGVLEHIVVRPQMNERVVLDECALSPELGVSGDNWAKGCWLSLPDGRPHPDVQVTLMNVRVAALVARTKERWALAGDQLFVDLDLSQENLPAGQRLRIGQALLEITAQAHRGCAKFAQRYGPDALAFVNSPVGRQLRLRGVYAKIVQAGSIKVGDGVFKSD